MLRDQILASIAQQPGITVAKLRDLMPARRSQLNNAILSLRVRGDIVSAGYGRYQLSSPRP